MTAFAQPYVAASDGSLVAHSDAAPNLGIIVVIAVVVLVALLLVGGGAARSRVVIVEQPARFAGSFLGVLVIAVAVGILFFTYLVPGHGSA